MRNKDSCTKSAKLIICLTGMPGAGKTTAAEVAKELDFDIVNMGEGVREEAIRQGLLLTDKNVGSIMLELRRMNGMEAVAQLALPKILSSKKKVVVVDGVRNFEEIEVFKDVGKVKILVIHGSPEIRFEYLRGRRRKDAPKSRKPFETRDEREISIGIVRIIALADEVISNNGISIAELQEKTRKVLLKWADYIEH
jgi:dephospho-CoA kinase|tara:strand:- start:133 stop:720 length:588 start_codon:yes stop_codon:yes gene_type:complete